MKTRNSILFEDNKLDIGQVCLQIFSLYKDCVSEVHRCLKFKEVLDVPFHLDATSFVDGATKDGFCACSAVHQINKDHYFTLKLNCGLHSNTVAELLALWCLWGMALLFGIDTLNVCVYSMVIVKWENELNQDVNPLWKCALKEDKGLLLWEEFLSQR